jgi:hypothetical protein
MRMPQKWLRRRILNRENYQSVGRQRNRSLQSEEHENLCPDARRVLQRVHTKGLKGSKHDEDGCPAMIEGERKMDEELIREIRRTVGLLDYIVDVLYIYAVSGAVGISQEVSRTVTAELTNRANMNAAGRPRVSMWSA